MYNIPLADFIADIPGAAIEVYAGVLALGFMAAVTGQGARTMLMGLIAVTLAPNPGSLFAAAILSLVVRLADMIRPIGEN